MFRRSDRPSGPPEDDFDRDVRALWPVVKPGYANIYRGKKNGMYPDLVGTISIMDEEAMSRYQRAGFIVWEG